MGGIVEVFIPEDKSSFDFNFGIAQEDMKERNVVDDS